MASQSEKTIDVDNDDRIEDHKDIDDTDDNDDLCASVPDIRRSKLVYIVKKNGEVMGHCRELRELGLYTCPYGRKSCKGCHCG